MTEEKIKISPEASEDIRKLKDFISSFRIEMGILKVLEEGLSVLISNRTADLNPLQRGRAWLNRSKKKEQDKFYIYFSPTKRERAEGYNHIQTAFAEGNFLKKELSFFELGRKSFFPPYVGNEFVPLLATLFEKFGFKITVH